jgi:hypothetical protein
MRQSTVDVQHFTVRTTEDPLSAAGAISAAVKNVDPRLSVDGVSTMDAVVRRVRGPWHFTRRAARIDPQSALRQE